MARFIDKSRLIADLANGNEHLPQPSFMDVAFDEARAAGTAGEVPVGCVIVRGGEVVARAGNRTLRDRDPNDR